MVSVLLFSFIIFLFVIWLYLSSAGISGLVQKKVEPKSKSNKRLKILLMVPCKGSDIQLERNLRSATKQNYSNYSAVAIVEGKEDPAFKAIKSSGIDYLIADPKYDRCSGKVKNLATAIAKFKGYDAYCIMDSDVNVGKGWLSSLASVMDEKIGIATAFPIFNPADGGFWSKAKYIWGFVGFGLMENPETRFGWGGTLLFRKELLESGGFDIFAESISDDIALTNLCKGKDLGISYVPEARPIVDCKETAPSFLEWSNRQTAFSVLGNRKILYMGLVFYGANVLLLVSALLLIIFSSFWFAILLLPITLYMAKSYQRSGRPYLELIPLCLIMNFVYLYNMANSAFMKRIEWRGKSYQLR